MTEALRYRGAMQVRRRRRQLFREAFEVRPITDANTTPLIDVMLVLLIMLMITLPISTHSIPVDLPGPGQSTSDAVPRIDRIEIAATGVVSWNGEAVTQDALKARLSKHVADPDTPVLYLKTESETPYDYFDHTLATVKRAGVTRLGFVDGGEESAW